MPANPTPIQRFARLTVIVLIALVAVAAVAPTHANDRPNIIFVFADDLGWGDLAVYGHDRIKSPNLDRMAREGTLFTQFYVNPTCSPSRAAIMTGHFPNRHRVHGHFGKPELNQRRAMPDFLDPEAPILPRELQKAGYKTAHFGKWHLSTPAAVPPPPKPDAYGFDVYHMARENNWPDTHAPEHTLWHWTNRHLSSERIIDQTIAFIEQNKDDGPFFINAWLLDTHSLLRPTVEDREPYKHLNARAGKLDLVGATTVYYSVVTKMDRHVGRLLKRLDELGLSDNTLLIFSSDNGPEVFQVRNASHSAVGSAGPFRGRKRSLYEGGIRVPFIARWPGTVPAGVVNNTSVMTGVDLLPTFIRLAGAELPTDYTPDGEDVSDILRGSTRKRTAALLYEQRVRTPGHVHHRSPALAIRSGDWKLLMNPDGSRIELYNIVDDPRELNNVAYKHPNTIDELRAPLMKFHADIPPGPFDADAGSDHYPWPGR
ncbi:MAG: sulfatase-like hydrolase/transferase [Planctomycetota bacterium]